MGIQNCENGGGGLENHTPAHIAPVLEKSPGVIFGEAVYI